MAFRSSRLCILVQLRNKAIPAINLNNSVRFLSTTDIKRSRDYDIVVVGGGIVGVSAAREISLRNPGKYKIAVVEKENALALHQTGNNSGVIHAGIYYKPGSLKAKLCVEGLHLMYDYCDKHKVPYKKCGKIIVATTPEQIKILNDLEGRARQNNVPDLKVLQNQEQIKTIEPYCRGLKALWSPHTGIINYRNVTLSFAEDFKKTGGEIHLNFKVDKFQESSSPDYPVTISSESGNRINTKYVFTCGGLYSDVLAIKSDCPREPQIIPFRGEYLVLDESKRHMVKGNIYPVPDPRFPFLGVHFTPHMDGSVLLGPNAVLALGREGYSWTAMNVMELKDTLLYPGFRKMALKYVGPGMKEFVKSALPSLTVKDLQQYIPEITSKDVRRGLAGVRAQAMALDGSLVDDFVFSKGEGKIGKRVLHCRNAPSPACTSSLAIAKMLADKMKTEFDI